MPQGKLATTWGRKDTTAHKRNNSAGINDGREGHEAFLPKIFSTNSGCGS